MIRPMSGAVLCLLLSGCSTADVQKEVVLLNKSQGAVEKALSTSKTFAQSKEAAVAQDIAHASQHLHAWNLSKGCLDVAYFGAVGTSPACTIEKITTPGTPDLPISESEAVERKMRVLASYLDAMTRLASAQSEKDLDIAFNAAKKSLAGVNKALGDAPAGEVFRALPGIVDIVQPVAVYVVKKSREAKLRKITAASQGDVEALIEEILYLLDALEVDPQFATLRQEMTASNLAAQQARAVGDNSAYQVQLTRLTKAQQKFSGYAQKSIFGLLRQISVAHTALTRQLQRKATIEEQTTAVIEFTTLAKQFLEATK